MPTTRRTKFDRNLNHKRCLHQPVGEHPSVISQGFIDGAKELGREAHSLLSEKLIRRRVSHDLLSNRSVSRRQLLHSTRNSRCFDSWNSMAANTQHTNKLPTKSIHILTWRKSRKWQKTKTQLVQHQTEHRPRQKYFSHPSNRPRFRPWCFEPTQPNQLEPVERHGEQPGRLEAEQEWLDSFRTGINDLHGFYVHFGGAIFRMIQWSTPSRLADGARDASLMTSSMTHPRTTERRNQHKPKLHEQRKSRTKISPEIQRKKLTNNNFKHNPNTQKPWTPKNNCLIPDHASSDTNAEPMA